MSHISCHMSHALKAAAETLTSQKSFLPKAGAHLLATHSPEMLNIYSVAYKHAHAGNTRALAQLWPVFFPHLGPPSCGLYRQHEPEENQEEEE